MGCGRWYLFVWAGRGGAGEALRRKGDKEVRNSWLWILHEGEESTANQMTAIHCDQKDDTVPLLAFRESQTDSGSQAPQCVTVGLCFQIEKNLSWRASATRCQVMCWPHVSSYLQHFHLKLKAIWFHTIVCVIWKPTKIFINLKSNTHCACLIPFVKLFALCTEPTGTVHISLAHHLGYHAFDTASQCDSACGIHFTEQIGVKHLANSPTN